MTLSLAGGYHPGRTEGVSAEGRYRYPLYWVLMETAALALVADLSALGVETRKGVAVDSARTLMHSWRQLAEAGLCSGRHPTKMEMCDQMWCYGWDNECECWIGEIADQLDFRKRSLEPLPPCDICEAVSCVWHRRVWDVMDIAAPGLCQLNRNSPGDSDGYCYWAEPCHECSTAFYQWDKAACLLNPITHDDGRIVFRNHAWPIPAEAHNARRRPEAHIQAEVIDTAEAHGWFVCQPHPTGTTTSKGAPDLLLARGGKVILVELKAEGGTVSEAQMAWHTAASTRIVWPSGLPALLAELAG